MNEHPCVARVAFDSWSMQQCCRPGKVEVDGKWYCGIHDPAKVAARQAKWKAKYDSAQEQQNAILAACEIAARDLGCGSAHYDWMTHKYVRALTITLEEAQSLIARLNAGKVGG